MRYTWLHKLCGCIVGLACASAGAQTLPAEATAPGAADKPPVVEGTMMHTARGGGQWQSFFNAHNAGVRAANREAIWFGAGENLWRYNVSRKALDAFVTPLTHPDVRISATVALADDGTFALSSGSHTYLWTLREGWARLPQVGANTNDHIPAFDAQSHLFVSNYQGFYRWSEGLWEPVQKGIGELRLAPVGDGWAQLNAATWYDPTLVQHRVYGQGPGRNAQLAGFFRVKGQALAFFWAPPEGQSWDNAVCSLYRVTPEAFTELGTGPYLGLDLASGEGFRCMVDADGKQAAMESLTGQKLGQMPVPPDFPTKSLLLRDANGDYWLGARRFDGHAWQAVLPAGAFDYAGDMQEAILTGRLQHDERKMTWVDTTPELPLGVKEYDPATRTGWLKREKHAGSNERTVWDRIAFAPDGTRKVLDSVPANDRNYYYCVPRFADAQGNWWFRARWRWDGQYGHVYDDGFEHRNMKENIVPPELVQSAAGTVWQYRMDRTWARYDRERNVFEPGSPYDEFSFAAGGRTLAIPARARDKEFEDAPYRVYEKRDGKWDGFETPFGVSMGPKAPWVFGLPGMMVRGSRMLVATQGGIFEWDTQRDVWAYLMPRGQYWACFDPHGHRIMSGDKLFNQILLYDGDPISPDPAAGVKLDPVLARIMRQLDADSWRQRDDATSELINLLRQDPRVVGEFLDKQAARTDLSAEVRARIERVLAERSHLQVRTTSVETYEFSLHSRLGNSLLDRMVQPLAPTFPGGYVIRVGMRCDLAESIFAASGAQDSVAIRQQHPGDPSYRGYLLRDNTMVYLRLDTKAQTITQLGLGTYGRGVDAQWPWDDATRNAAKSIELKPAPTSQPAIAPHAANLPTTGSTADDRSGPGRAARQ